MSRASSSQRADREVGGGCISDDQQRGVDAAVDAVTGRVRQTILLSLATAGRANVGALADRTGIDPTTLGHHLGRLKLMGFLHSRREGKQVFYACAPGRVRADRGPDGLSITVTHGSGVSVTLSAPIVTAVPPTAVIEPNSPPPPAAPE